MKRTKILLAGMLAICIAGSSMSQVTDNAIVFDEISGPLYGSDSVWINCGGELVFRIRVEMKEDVQSLNSFINGFRVYSPDGATWQDVTPAFVTSDWSSSTFPVIAAEPVGSPTGSGADTVRFLGTAILGGLGVPSGGYSEPAWEVAVTLNHGPAHDGLTICIDSVFNAATAPNPVYQWRWLGSAASYPPAGDIMPAFSGPQCVTLVYAPLFSCGNVNCDTELNIDLSDLIYLVNYLFLGGPAPIVPAWAMIDCTPGIDLSDLIWLVNYLFNGGPAPCEGC
ncbi:hypothetical protein KQH82_05710 [bacterium]|nr:hypothetical protein [bacterium]